MVIISLLPNIITIVILVYGGHLVLSGDMSPGSLVSFLLYQSSLSDSFNNLSYVWSNMAEAFGASDKVWAFYPILELNIPMIRVFIKQNLLLNKTSCYLQT